MTAITFRGAMRILGHYDRPWLDRLDRLLGGVILASGTVPAVGVLWGWVDQKNEATGLLRTALDAATNRLTRTDGLARHELVIAAHTTLVMSALFETLRDMLGPHDKVSFTKAEKLWLSTDEWPLEGEPLIRSLYAADVPSPSVVRGFEENVAEVEAWAESRAENVDRFLGHVGDFLVPAQFAIEVADRYRSDYLRFATKVPEFAVWSDLTEHAATRRALAGLEDLLFQSTHVPRDLRTLVGEVNRAELGRPVIDVDIDGYGINAVFPTVERIFLNPHFRCVEADRDARIGDERWWEDLPPRQDLDTALARHFSSADSTQLPMLLLGHPGAGKSLLMKVLAARLPASTYTVVRVPLRRVDADANVSTQIQQALSLATNGRVTWPDLADQSDDAIRVVLLDGLDELLQATTNDRAGYLTDIVEFQRIEEALGKPVAVVVTSRTLVADRVRVPNGTPVLKLEDFDNDQIEEWLLIWHEVNRDTRPVLLTAVMAQEELARQPLLLLMLTLYFADPDAPSTDMHLSTVELYQRLLDTYARREVTKQAGRVLSDDERADAVRTQLNRLSIAALGMFNRGRQSITEAELSADLAALGESAPAGTRLLGEFFFVHAPEATAGEVQRGYEFLHATFAEYLVATKVMEVLEDVAEGAFGRRRAHEPEDELLFALLSHQPLAIQRPVLQFINEHFASMDLVDRTYILQTLAFLIRGYRQRRPSTRYPDYRPMPPDTIRTLAAYSANLLVVRVLADPEGAEITTLWPDDPNAWPATVSLWAAGLDAEGYRAMLSTIDRGEDRLKLKDVGWHDSYGAFNEFNAARLRGDEGAERRLRYGHAILGEAPIVIATSAPHNRADEVISVLLGLMVGYSPTWFADPPSDISNGEVVVTEVAHSVLGLYGGRWDRVETERFIRWMMSLPASDVLSPLPLVLAEHHHPGLLEELRSNPDGGWTKHWRSALTAASRRSPRSVVAIAKYLAQVVPRAWTVPRSWGE